MPVTFEQLPQIEAQVIGNICCLNCTLVIKRPVILFKRDTTQQSDTLKVKGAFCSFVCGFRYIRNVKDARRKNDYELMLK